MALVVEPEAGRGYERSRDLREHLDDAIDLGAVVVHAEAADPADAVIETARQRRATHVVVPHRPASRLTGLTRRPLPDAILAALPDVEVHLVADPG